MRDEQLVTMLARMGGTAKQLAHAIDETLTVYVRMRFDERKELTVLEWEKLKPIVEKARLMVGSEKAGNLQREKAAQTGDPPAATS